MQRDIWQFEGFTFSSASGLVHDGVAVRLQAKPRKLLELLLRASGGVVLKDSIAAALWSDEAPSDASIARAVSGLRKALTTGGNDIVRTIYGEGVQLACAIKSNSDGNMGEHDAAMALLQTAREIVSDRKPDNHSRALEMLRYAVARYPGSAITWASMADLYASMAVRGLIVPTEAVARINHCCQMALQADPLCRQALAASGWAIGALTARKEEGQRRLDASINGDSNWLAFFYCAWLKALNRDLAGAVADLERGLALSPLDRSLLATRAFFTLYQGKFEAAEALAREGQKLRSDIDGLWLVRSIVACEAGDFAGGCLFAERAAALLERDRRTLAYLAYAYARAGQADRAQKILAKIGPGVNGHTPAFLAAPYLALGNTAEAIRIVDVAEAERCPNRAIIWCDPRLKPLWQKI